ncbi:hypothetical protein Hanom_Chr06g00507261 [Helianthus anomalus]
MTRRAELEPSRAWAQLGSFTPLVKSVASKTKMINTNPSNQVDPKLFAQNLRTIYK